MNDILSFIDNVLFIAFLIWSILMMFGIEIKQAIKERKFK